MDTTNSELDSFTVAMLAKASKRQQKLDNLDDTECVGSVELDENDEKRLHEGSSSEEDDSLLLPSDMAPEVKEKQMRKSISMLLHIGKPVSPDNKDVDLKEPVDSASTTRLNKRLGKLAELYHDETEGTTKVLTQNKVNIATIAEDADTKPKGALKDRLKQLTQSYYPKDVHDDDEAFKPVTPFKLPSQHTKESVATSKLAVKPKMVKFIERFDTPNKSANSVPSPKKMTAPSALPKPVNSVPAKKTSVADLKKIFESKVDDGQPKEPAPELLSLREKKRLFEKAIREESEASKNVYRGQRRVMELSPTRSDETEAKRQKNTVEEEEKEADCSQNEVAESRPNDSENMSICTDFSSVYTHSSIYEEEEKEAETHVEEENKSEEVLQVSTVSVDESLYKATENEEHFDELSSDTSDQFSSTIPDFTFTAIDADDQLQRSSTKVELVSKSVSQSSVETSSSQSSQKSIETHETEFSDDAPPIRTISFYRREQKAKQAAAIASCNSPAPANGQQKHLIAVKQQDAAREEFLRYVHNRIIAMRNDISEHNRILSQASQALKLTYQTTITDSELIEGRVEANRLLIVAEEKRRACKVEIDRLKGLQANPEKYVSMNVPVRGVLKISNLVIPLRKEFVELRAKGKAPTYYFICLVINGPSVYVSDLLDTSKTAEKENLEFKFKAYCKDLKDDFAVRIQLYAMENQSQNSLKKEAGFRSFRIKFGTSSLKKSEKAALAAVNSPMPPKLNSTILNSSFKLIGVVPLTLPLLRQKPVLYRFESAIPRTVQEAPIDGYMSIGEQSLTVQHHLSAEGFFDMQDEKTSFWNLRRVVIDGSQLKYWRFPDPSAENGPPLGVINLKHCINPTVAVLKGEFRNLCMRKNSFVLVTMKPPSVSNAQKLVQGGMISQCVPQMYFISSSNSEDAQIFCEQINCVLRGIRAWENDAVRPYSIDEFNRLLLKDHL